MILFHPLGWRDAQARTDVGLYLVGRPRGRRRQRSAIAASPKSGTVGVIVTYLIVNRES